MSRDGSGHLTNSGTANGNPDVAIDMVELDDINHVSSQPRRSNVPADVPNDVPADYALMNSFARAKYAESQRYDAVDPVPDAMLDAAPSMTKHRRILAFAAVLSLILGVIVIIVANVTDGTRSIKSTVDTVYILMTVAGIMAIVTGSLAAATARFLYTKFLGFTILINAIAAVLCLVAAIMSLSTTDDEIDKWAADAWLNFTDEEKASWQTTGKLAHEISQDLLGMGILAVLLLVQCSVTIGASMAIFRRKSDQESLLKREAVLQERIAARKRAAAEAQASRAPHADTGAHSADSGGYPPAEEMRTGGSSSVGAAVSGGRASHGRVDKKRQNKQAVSQAMLNVPVPRGQ